MIPIDFEKRIVLITGGTRGFGRSIAKEFARGNASVVVTHRWGSVDESELRSEFEREGLAPPVVIESDVSDPQATRELMTQLRDMKLPLHAVISNVAFAKIVRDLDDLTKNALDLSLSYSAWPIVDLIQAAKSVLGVFPKYVIGISSDADRWCHTGYDLVGASKAVLESLCRYLAVRLKPEGVRVNAIAPAIIDSESLRATFGEAAAATLREQGAILDASRAAKSCVALTSGLLDAVTGQTIIVDEGWCRVSPISIGTNTVGRFAFPEEELLRRER